MDFVIFRACGGFESVFVAQRDFLVSMVEEAVQTILEVEMEECLRAGRYERTEERTGHRKKFYDYSPTNQHFSNFIQCTGPELSAGASRANAADFVVHD